MRFQWMLWAVIGLGLVSCGLSSEDSEVKVSPSDGRAQIEFYNKCPWPVVFGRMGKGDIATLGPQGRNVRDLGPDSAAYPALAYYGYRQGEHPGFGHMSLAEFSINAWNKMDFYDVSLVDGFNIGIRISNRANSCRPAICGGDLVGACPASQKIYVGGKAVACSKKGDRDNPNNPAARLFESRCENAYSWSKDDAATVGCDAQDYLVTFCPYL